MQETSARSLAGKVAMITGSSRGIGLAQAMLMAERGADIVLHDLKREAVEEAAPEVRKLGRRVHVAVADMTDIAAVTRCAKEAEQALGRVDILVNNAGISGYEAALESIDEANFDRMFGIHVKGSFFLTQTVVAGMKQRRYGKIINISSNRGMVGHTASSHYCAAKAALLGLTKAWARELAPYNIHVNAVAPGVVHTAMTTWGGMGPLRDEADQNPLKRWAEPIEIAYAVVFLVSGEADYITGQVLSPNGGYPIVGI